MSGKKYVGWMFIRKHRHRCRDGNGKLVAETTLQTQPRPIRDYVRGLSGPRARHLREGAQARVALRLLEPPRALRAGVQPAGEPLGASANKSDRIDAVRLSEWLYKGTLKAVYHATLDKDLQQSVAPTKRWSQMPTRTRNRLKASIARRPSRSVVKRPIILSADSPSSSSLKDPAFWHGPRCSLVSSTSCPPARRCRARAWSRGPRARGLHGAPLDSWPRAHSHRRHHRRHQDSAPLPPQPPALGPTRDWLSSQARAVSRSFDGELRRRKGVVHTRGLNTNYNRRLKEALKGAAETAATRSRSSHSTRRCALAAPSPSWRR